MLAYSTNSSILNLVPIMINRNSQFKHNPAKVLCFLEQNSCFDTNWTYLRIPNSSKELKKQNLQSKINGKKKLKYSQE